MGYVVVALLVVVVACLTALLGAVGLLTAEVAKLIEAVKVDDTVLSRIQNVLAQTSRFIQTAETALKVDAVRTAIRDTTTRTH